MPANPDDFLPLFEHTGSRADVHDFESFSAIPKQQWPLHAATEFLRFNLEAKDNGEPLVHLRDLIAEANSHMILSASTAAYGAKDADMLLREGAAKRLMEAEKHLHHVLGDDWTFRVTDAYRPLSLQREYFNEVKAKFEAQGFSGDELYAHITEVIADPDHFPPHGTGAAVDLTIINWKTGKELPMGTEVDEIDNDKIHTFHQDLPDDQKRNRMILFACMIEAGFVNYPNEWWHFAYGERDWALRTEQPFAIYDVIR